MTDTEINEGHLLAVDDALSALTKIEPVLSYQAAEDTAMAIVATLIAEGWIIEPQQCEHKDNTNALDCETWLRPGKTTCDKH